jgi:multiple sugar transport system substrate-binding protein
VIGVLSALAAAAIGFVAVSAALASSPQKLSGKIVVWDFNANTPQGKSYPGLIKQFEKLNPGVKVDEVAKPAGNYNTVVQAAMAAKSGPDVLMVNAPDMITRYSKELTPLQITPTLRKQFASWGSMNPSLNPNGPIYGLPYSFSGTTFYYNKQLWAKAGLDPNAPFPRTYDGLVADLQKLKAAGITPLGGGDKGGDDFGWWMYLAVPGVMPLKDCYGLDTGATKWNDPRMKEVVTEWLNFVQSGFLAPNQQELNVGDFSGFGNFVNGQAALVWAFPGYRPHLATGDATNVGTAATSIGFANQKPYFYMAGPVLGWTIPKWSKNQAAAFAFIKWIAGTHAQQLHLNIDGVGPTNTKVNMSKAPADLRAAFNTWKANPNNAHCGVTWNFQVFSALFTGVAGVEAGQGSVQSALDAAERVQEQVLAAKPK